MRGRRGRRFTDVHGTRCRPGVARRQCRKCRSPVKTIARPSSSARAMISSSRTEPPGCTTTATPAAAAASTPSANGIERVGRGTRRPAPGLRPSSPRSRPTRRGSAGRRRCRRPGRPSPARSQFDFTCPQIRHASSASRHCSVVGATLVTTRQSSRPAAKCGGVLHEEAAGDLAEVERVRRRARAPRGAACSCASARSASSVPGLVAGRDRRRRPAARRPFARRWRRRSDGCSATIPPNAERSSHSSARWYAVARSSATATPHGLACLMMAHAGCVTEVVRELPRRLGVVVVEVAEREPAVLRDAVPPARWCRRGGSAPPAGAGSRRSAALVGALEREHEVRGQQLVAPGASATIAASYAAVRANASSARRAAGLVGDRGRRSRQLGEHGVVLLGARHDRRPTRGSWPRRGPSPVRRCRWSRCPGCRGTGRGSTRRARTARCRAASRSARCAVVAEVGEQAAVDLRVQRLRPGRRASRASP